MRQIFSIHSPPSIVDQSHHIPKSIKEGVTGCKGRAKRTKTQFIYIKSLLLGFESPPFLAAGHAHSVDIGSSVMRVGCGLVGL